MAADLVLEGEGIILLTAKCDARIKGEGEAKEEKYKSENKSENENENQKCPFKTR